MIKKTLSLTLGMVLALVLAMSFVSAVQSFSVSQTSFSQTAIIGSTGTGSFSVTNTGNESITINLNDTDLSLGSNTMTLSLSSTSVTLATNGASSTITFSYDTTGESPGTYTGSIGVFNSANTNDLTTVSLSTVVSSASGALIELANNDDGVIEMAGDIDERNVDERVRFRNEGNISLTGVTISISDLEGDSSGDDIDRDEVDFDENNFDLDEGDSQRVEIEIDIPDDIEEDLYVGTITVDTDQGESFTFTLELTVSADDLDVEISRNGENVRSGVLEVFGEAGELVDDFNFIVINDGNVDLQNLEFELDGDLEEEFSSASIDESAVTFNPTQLDLDGDDQEDVEIKIQIPEGQASGTYFADLKVFTSSGNELDEITLQLEVVGEIFISGISFNEDVEPGDILNVEVKVRNQESKVQRNVKVTGTIFDIDTANSDVTETSSTFILNAKEEKTETLRFRVPEDASDGSHTMEVRVTFGSEEIVKVEEVNVKRPSAKMGVESFVINPATAICDDQVLTFTKIKNLGRFEEDVKITAEIVGTSVKAQTSTFEVEVDEIVQRNLALDISNLDPGTYTVREKIAYASQFEEVTSTLRVEVCRDNIGVDVKPIDPTDNGENSNSNSTSADKVNLFGQELEKSTVYLGSGIGAVVILIVIALFLI